MKIAQGGYGHNPSGKLYSYWVPDDARVGQRFVAPVKPGKKEYDTMWTLVVSRGQGEEYATREEERLVAMGIRLKKTKGMNVMDLPGGKKYTEDPRYKNIQSMKTAWTKDSNNRAFDRLLNQLWVPTAGDTRYHSVNGTQVNPAYQRLMGMLK